jgi:hypothetical protein
VHRIYTENQEEDEAMIGMETEGERKAQGEG